MPCGKPPCTILPQKPQCLRKDPASQHLADVPCERSCGHKGRHACAGAPPHRLPCRAVSPLGFSNYSKCTASQYLDNPPCDSIRVHRGRHACTMTLPRRFPIHPHPCGVFPMRYAAVRQPPRPCLATASACAASASIVALSSARSCAARPHMSASSLVELDSAGLQHAPSPKAVSMGPPRSPPLSEKPLGS